MNPKQRYLAAVNRPPTDRPPFDLMDTACGLFDGLLARLKALKGVTSADRSFRKGQNVGRYNDELLAALGIDARRVWLRQLPETEPSPKDGRVVDDWGIEHAKCGGHIQQVNWPLREAGLREIEAYSVPAIADPRRVEDLREEARKLHDAGCHAVIGRSATMCFFEIGCALRGMEQYFMDMVEEPAVIEALNEKILNLQMELYGLYLDACGEYLDVIETGDDYGSGTGPLVSPAAQALARPDECLHQTESAARSHFPSHLWQRPAADPRPDRNRH